MGGEFLGWRRPHYVPCKLVDDPVGGPERGTPLAKVRPFPVTLGTNDAPYELAWAIIRPLVAAASQRTA